MSLSLAIHGALLIFTGSLQALLQERLLKGSYGASRLSPSAFRHSYFGPPAGSDAQHLDSTSLVIFFNGSFAVLLSLTLIVSRNRGAGLLRSLRPTSPPTHYALVGAYGFLATSCQYQSLYYVSLCE